MANNVTIIGRLGRDGEGRVTPAGDRTFSFSVADDVGFGDKKTTNWWNCTLWGKQAEGKITDFLRKGQQVAVMGEIKLREWEDKDGNKRLAPEIRVNSVQLCGGRDNAEPRAAEPVRQAAPKAAAYDDGDVPF